ncbi:MAG TPA: SagB/ThcOx family dehydrogenase [Bacteroidales bacterium]|nr:SagB/ThcOx family dehydrogenase [Bacteroidales bacterium]HPM19410.1 SagB/ThcOx family dehydrogenase [Bacteroidales bacterium]HQG78274.1 SagB/ThcOx family dehydrogenase [Bacteroidales bacterium]
MMENFNFPKLLAALTLVICMSSGLSGQDIVLPSPRKTGGKPLMQALNERSTTRDFTKDELSLQQISGLLWAGFGINRPDIRKRTAPSAVNWQEIDIYVSMASGLYIYDAESNLLRQVHDRDIRSACGTQGFVAEAPLNLVYVADLTKCGKKEGDKVNDSDLFMPYADCAFIGQNIYLFCASENLGCVIRGSIPKERLAKEMNLRPMQRILLSQTVGIPSK